MTPRERTVTSGFWRSFRLSGVSLVKLKKLNRRTLYGQLFEQYRVPMHRLYTMALSPSLSWTVAATGQTCSHGAFSQCMHGTGWKTTWGSTP